MDGPGRLGVGQYYMSYGEHNQMYVYISVSTIHIIIMGIISDLLTQHTE